MAKEMTGLKGFFRLQLTEPDGEVVGDSGWIENVVTNAGSQRYIQYVLGASAGSMVVTAVGIGTGGEPTAATTQLPGECDTDLSGGYTRRVTPTLNFDGSSRIDWQFTFASNEAGRNSSFTINNVGLYNSTASNSGSLAAGASYTGSTWETNQAVNGTYSWTWS